MYGSQWTRRNSYFVIDMSELITDIRFVVGTEMYMSYDGDISSGFSKVAFSLTNIEKDNEKVAHIEIFNVLWFHLDDSRSFIAAERTENVDNPFVDQGDSRINNAWEDEKLTLE
jgi:hypothetical protein